MQSPESNPGCYNVDEAGAVRKGTFQLWLRVWGSIQGGVEGRGNKEGICTSSTDHWTSDCGCGGGGLAAEGADDDLASLLPTSFIRYLAWGRDTGLGEVPEAAQRTEQYWVQSTGSAGFSTEEGKPRRKCPGPYLSTLVLILLEPTRFMLRKKVVSHSQGLTTNLLAIVTSTFSTYPVIRLVLAGICSLHRILTCYGRDVATANTR
ncbi:hypothetical protein NQ176_g8740 [Zarea fungicola]|uniref:Uncharacterized protein n=1 Tax=Zarea fungicola TaxID=93591 RepID=A0ACC1MS02_9HYPO|nr:hypothetical protein NQ176_g8740 [Lecanicillium fungicola]